jgi:hypothetical protein
MRNRLSNLDAKNKRFMAKVTDDLARRIGFRAAPGFSERVIFRELFLQGLTVLDVMEADANVKISISHIAARQEVRDLLKTLNINAVNERMEKMRLNEEGGNVDISEQQQETATIDVASDLVAGEVKIENNASETKEVADGANLDNKDDAIIISKLTEIADKAAQSKKIIGHDDSFTFAPILQGVGN